MNSHGRFLRNQSRIHSEVNKMKHLNIIRFHYESIEDEGKNSEKKGDSYFHLIVTLCWVSFFYQKTEKVYLMPTINSNTKIRVKNNLLLYILYIYIILLLLSDNWNTTKRKQYELYAPLIINLFLLLSKLLSFFN